MPHVIWIPPGVVAENYFGQWFRMPAPGHFATVPCRCEDPWPVAEPEPAAGALPVWLL